MFNSATDMNILEEMISMMRKEMVLSEKDIELWKSHCMENEEWDAIKRAFLRVENQSDQKGEEE